MLSALPGSEVPRESGASRCFDQCSPPCPECITSLWATPSSWQGKAWLEANRMPSPRSSRIAQEVGTATRGRVVRAFISLVAIPIDAFALLIRGNSPPAQKLFLTHVCGCPPPFLTHVCGWVLGGAWGALPHSFQLSQALTALRFSPWGWEGPTFIINDRQSVPTNALPDPPASCAPACKTLPQHVRLFSCLGTSLEEGEERGLPFPF